VNRSQAPGVEQKDRYCAPTADSHPDQANLNPANAVQNDVVIKKIEDFILIFTSIVWEAFPFIVLGAAIAGFLEEFVPQRLIARILPRNRVLAILLGATLGLVFPMCECGIIPVMRRLLRKGLPLSCCIAYLLAGPIINVVVMLSTYAAFSGENLQVGSQRQVPQMSAPLMVALRVGMGYLVAVGVALVVEWRYRRHGNTLLAPLAVPPPDAGNDDDNNHSPPRERLHRRISNVTETALHDFVDILVFLVLGAMLAASVRMYWTNDDLAQRSSDHPILLIATMMGLAVLLCLCSEADAFVAASFVTLPSAAKLAFLVLGPMLDLKLYLMYTRVFRPRLIWTIIPTVVLMVFTYSVIVHYLWTNLGVHLGLATNP
jgi:hypothetical protein